VGVSDMVRRRAWRRSYVLPEHTTTGSLSSRGSARGSTASSTGAAEAAGGGGGGGATPVEPPPRIAVTDTQIAGLQKILAKSSRSTLVLLDNQTPWTLRLLNAHCDSGSFPGNGKPAPRLRPNELVMCGSISKWVGDTEAIVTYCVDESPDERISLKWKNPMVDDPFSDRGKWSHGHLHGSRLDLRWTLPDGTVQHRSSSVHPRPTQELNNRLVVSITVRGQTGSPWQQVAAAV
jgi:hypothetical protein